MEKFVFLDRDGVINRKIEGDYVSRFSDFEFLEGVKEALKDFYKNNFKVIIITNQQGIGKKILTTEMLSEVHKKMSEEISKSGGKITDIFFCPHLASDNCECRKPKPGMLIEAAKKYNISLSETFFIGDSATDIQAGVAVGAKTIYLSNLKSNKIDKSIGFGWTFQNLKQAANFILQN
mgnify:CR=1 FL=1